MSLDASTSNTGGKRLNGRGVRNQILVRLAPHLATQQQACHSLSVMSRTDPLSLEDRVAVVLGGTSGIGLAIASGLANAGAHVIPTSRRLDAVREACRQVESIGRRTVMCTSDVLDRTSLEQVRGRALSEFGQIDIMVNCAGTTKRTPSLDVSEEEWDSIIETNLTGTFRACQVFGRAMLQRGSGSIINIASLTSHVGFMEVAATSASKSGVLGLTKALAVEWAKKGVRVNAICPGVFLTPLNEHLLRNTAGGNELVMRTPMQRFGDTRELAGAAVYLASDASGFVTGTSLVVDGGFLASGANQ
jgi:NAD(P)-dependent dehydrogenase (short-subunit alcohol dehydrogenase family)